MNTTTYNQCIYNNNLCIIIHIIKSHVYYFFIYTATIRLK